MTLNPGDVIPMDIMEVTFPESLTDSGRNHYFAGMLNRDAGEFHGDYSGAGFVIRE